MIRALLIRLCVCTGRFATLLRYCGPDHFTWAEFLRRRGMSIGPNTSINPRAEFMDPQRVTIGRDCSISLATFVTHSGSDRIMGVRHGRAVRSDGWIHVGDGVTIGSGVEIRYGVTIGDDAIVGMGCTVSSYVPSGVMLKAPEPIVAGLVTDYAARAEARLIRGLCG